MADKPLLGGVHGVRAALLEHADDVESLLYLDSRQDARLDELLALARQHGVATEAVRRQTLDRLAERAELQAHQGVMLRLRREVGGPRKDGLADHLASVAGPALVLVLDEVQDPHNLGACLRSAEAAGVDAVVTPRDNSVGLTATVRKVAAGAAETVPWFQVTNLVRGLQTLKEAGLWIHGAAGEGTATLYDTDLGGAVALVMGAEGRGLRRLTRTQCDSLFRIPMLGSVESLNVSVATGVSLFEARRQRGLASR